MTTATKTKGAIVAHWKGFRSSDDARRFLADLAHYHGDRTIYLALPLNLLYLLSKEIFAPSIILGANGMVDVTKGSFSEPVATEILIESGAQFVLLGDSDSRHTHIPIAEKMVRCIESGLQPFLCVGETLADYHQGRTALVLNEQLTAALEHLSPEQRLQVAFIHENCWNLRFAREVSNEEITETATFLRQACSALLGKNGQSVSCFTALPPYIDDLSTLPEGSATAGFYLSKAAIIPQALKTADTKKHYQRTAETIAHIEKALQQVNLHTAPATKEAYAEVPLKKKKVATASASQKLPQGQFSPKQEKTPLKPRKLFYSVEDLTDFF